MFLPLLQFKQFPVNNDVILQYVECFLCLQALSVLEAMASNKQYSELHVSVNQACQFIKYPNHCLRDANTLLTLLVNALYTDLHYLDIIR